MIKLLVVGDEPSSKNVSKHVAFVGTKSFTTLIEWIEFLQPHYYLAVNSNSDHDWNVIYDLSKTDFKIIALGNNASDKLGSIAHYKLPHPSPANKKAQKDIIVKLRACKQWLRQ